MDCGGTLTSVVLDPLFTFTCQPGITDLQLNKQGRDESMVVGTLVGAGSLTASIFELKLSHLTVVDIKPLNVSLSAAARGPVCGKIR